MQQKYIIGLGVAWLVITLVVGVVILVFPSGRSVASTTNMQKNKYYSQTVPVKTESVRPTVCIKNGSRDCEENVAIVPTTVEVIRK